jgi:enoyl-CoA hydratase
MELALACHHRVAEANAVLALPESTYGMMPGCGGTVRLPRLVGEAVALELILTGRTISAEEAVRIGLLDECVERGHGRNAALNLIGRYRKQAP